MNQRALQNIYDLKKGENVFLFPTVQKATMSSVAFDVLRLLMESRDLEEVIERKMEAIIMQKQFELIRNNTNAVIDSFDPVYLEQLNPDDLHMNDVTELDEFKNIVDYSDQLTFQDGLD